MPVLIKNMTSNNETSIISTSVSDPVPDPDSGFIWIWIRIEFWIPDSMNMYPKKTDWNIGRNNLMVPIAELFKIRIEIASYSTCSELLKNRI